MKKAKQLTKQDLENVIRRETTPIRADLSALRKHVDSSFDTVRDNIKNLVQHFNESQVQQTQHFEKLLAEQLAEHHGSLVEAISEVVIKDRIEPLELRVTRLEARKI